MLRTSAFLGEARRGIGRRDRYNYLINGQCQIFPMRTNRIEMTQGLPANGPDRRPVGRRGCATMSDRAQCIATSSGRDAKATVPRGEITTVVICRKAFSVQYCLVYWLH